MYECEKCGGELRFDIPSQKLVCAHCDGVFDPETYGKGVYAESGDFEVNVLTCPNCGGEVTTTNLAAIAYCPYCGRASVPVKKAAKEKMPERILPFAVTKEDAKEAYRKKLARNPFAPGKLRDEAFLESFNGVYLPFWSYDVGFSEHPKVKKKESHNEGNYKVTEHYEYTGDMEAGYVGITYDASSYFDDVIGQSIVPFDQTESKAFNPSYMFGFYGEKQDVSAEVYEQEAIETANQNLFKKLEESFPGETLEYPENYLNREAAFGSYIKKTEGVFLPVWFLTWRDKDKVAYAVVNGHNGRTYADIPASLPRILIGALLLAIPLFLIYYFVLPTFTVYTMLLISSAIGLWAAYISQKIAGQLIDEEERINKKAAFLRQSELSKSGRSRAINQKRQKHRIRASGIGQKIGEGITDFFTGGFFGNVLTLFVMVFHIIIPILLIGMGAISFIAGLSRRTLRSLLYAAILVGLFLIILFRKKIEDPKKKKAVDRSIFGSSAAIILAVIVHLIDPARDIIYYAASTVVMVSVFISLISVVRQYNRLATHPDPHFYERGGQA